LKLTLALPVPLAIRTGQRERHAVAPELDGGLAGLEVPDDLLDHDRRSYWPMGMTF